jgi:O-Antigen ligase
VSQFQDRNVDIVSTVSFVIIGLSLGTFAALFVYRHPTLLWYAIGASAGLRGAEIGKVHIFTFLCAAAFMVDREPAVRGRSGRCLLIMAAVACLSISSILGTLVSKPTLAFQLLGLAACSCFVALHASPASRRRMFQGLLAMCVLGSAVAVAQKAGILPYTPFVDASGTARVTGFYHEPDWLGLYAACGFLLLFMLPFDGRRTVQTGAGTILLAGLVLSGARAAWLALAITFLLMLVGLARAERHRNTRFIGLAAVLAAIVLLVFPTVLTGVVSRLNTSGSNAVSVQARDAQQNELEQLVRTAPWFGYGLSASGRVGVTGQLTYTAESNGVASNWVLGWLVDGKDLAIPLILLFIGTGALAIRKPSGLILCLVLVNSLYSNAIVEPIAWMALGLAIVDIPTRRSSSITSAAVWPPGPAPTTGDNIG